MKSIVYIVVLSLFITYCSHSPKKTPPLTSPLKIKNQLKKAQKLRSQGKTQRALLELSEIANEAPTSDSADDAYMIMGESYYEDQEYEKAYKAYLSIIRSDTHSPIEIDAYLGAIHSLNQLGRYDEALSLLGESLKYKGIDQETIMALLIIRATLFTRLGEQIEALKSFVLLSQKHPDPKKRELYKSQSIEMAQEALSIEELAIVTKQSSMALVHPTAHLILATHYYNQKKFSRSQSHIKMISQEDTQAFRLAQELLQKIINRETVHRNTIGVILPLTGKHSRQANSILQGLQLSLGIFNTTTRSPYTLAVVDSGSHIDTAKRAVERLVLEDHVIAIIGGLLTKTAGAISSKANELGVPNISLSQKPRVTEIGTYVFRNALTSEMLVRQLVKNVMVGEKLKRFAILYPNDHYGVKYANLFWDEVLARGGSIVAAQTYEAKETDFNQVIKRLIGTFYLEDREEEYKEELKKWLAVNKKSKKHRSTPPELKPIINFDALFVPDSTKAVGQIAPMLAYHDVKGTRLLGTSLWNQSSLIKRGQRYVEGAMFVDGFSISNGVFKNSTFFKEYEQTFNERPGVLAAQAYDTGLIVKSIIEMGVSSRKSFRGQLAKLDEFQGALGLLKMNKQREILRPILDLRVTNGQIQLDSKTK